MIIDFNKNNLIIFFENTVVTAEFLDLPYLLTKNPLVFINLKEYGLQTLHILYEAKIKIRHVISFNSVIYAIYIDYCTIKCYENFGLKLVDNNYKKLLDEIYILNDFSVENLHKSLKDSQINSIGAIALNFLKKKAEHHPFLTLSNDLENDIRQAYFGGRCELYLPGKHEELYFYDFPSMYGNIMLNEYPTIILEKQKFKEEFLKKKGFFEVIIEQTQHKPVLPIKVSGNLFFINGSFKNFYWCEELDFFKKRGGIIKEYCSFIETKDFKKIFEKPVKFLLNRKDQGCYFSKKIINSMYGRLSLTKTDIKTKILFECDERDLLRNKNILSYSKYKNIFLIKSSDFTEKKIDCNLAAAAIITSRARIKLYKLIEDVEKLNAEVVYVDTDSCFVKLNNKTNLKDFFNLVSWQKLSDCIFYLEKNYSYKNDQLSFLIGEKKEFCKSFKRCNVNNFTQPFSKNYFYKN